MSRNIILRGGLYLLSKSNTIQITQQAVYSPNILLKKSPDWVDGIIYIHNIPYYRLLPSVDNRIELKNIHNYSSLLVNGGIIYQSNNLLNYTVNINLSECHDNITKFYEFYQ